MSLSTDASQDASSLAAAFYEDLYEEWKRHGKHWEEYASEMLGTAFLLFCMVGAIAFLFGSSAFLPRLIPSSALRLLLVGLLLGGAGGLVALTPPGRLSGAHLNPATSLGFWVLGKMHGRDGAGYIAGQFLGGLSGAFVGGLVFGRLAAEVHTGALHPGRGVGWAGTLGGELAATFALSLAVFTFLSHERLARWMPLMATGLVVLLVCADGNFSGVRNEPCALVRACHCCGSLALRLDLYVWSSWRHGGGSGSAAQSFGVRSGSPHWQAVSRSALPVLVPW